MITNTENYYEILGVTPSATANDIRKAYIQMIRQYPNETHPEEFKIIRKAFETLYDATSRHEYDQKIQDNGNYQQQIDEINGYLRQQQFQTALSSIQYLEREYPEDSFLLYLKARCYFNLQRYFEGEKVLKSLIIQDPYNEDYFFLLSSIYFDQGQFDKALKPCKKLVELNPAEMNYHIRLSSCYCDLSEYREACRVLENKLSEGQTTVYDFPLYTELYFITALMGDEGYHNQVIDRIEGLPSNLEEKRKLLNMMINLVEGLATNHNMFKELISIVHRINNGAFDHVTDWVRNAESHIDPTLIYYGDQNPNGQQKISNDTNLTSGHDQGEMNTSSYEVNKERGSILWSFVLGIIVSIIFTPIVGIIVGFVYYFNAEKLKEILSCLGCLLVILFIFGFIIGVL